MSRRALSEELLELESASPVSFARVLFQKRFYFNIFQPPFLHERPCWMLKSGPPYAPCWKAIQSFSIPNLDQVPECCLVHAESLFFKWYCCEPDRRSFLAVDLIWPLLVDIHTAPREQLSSLVSFPLLLLNDPFDLSRYIQVDVVLTDLMLDVVFEL